MTNQNVKIRREKKGQEEEEKRNRLPPPQRLDVLPVVRFPENCDSDMLATVDPWTVWKNKKGGGGVGSKMYT